MFAHVNWFDYVLIFIILASVVIGFMRGAARSFVSLLTWAVAFLAGIIFSNILALALEPFIKPPTTAQLISFILLVVVVLIIGFLVNYLIGLLVDASGHSVGSRFFGLIFGLAKGGMIVLFVIFIISNTTLQEQPFFTSSQLSYWFQGASVWISGKVIVEEPAVQSTKESVQPKIEAARGKLKVGYEAVKAKAKSDVESVKKAVD